MVSDHKVLFFFSPCSLRDVALTFSSNSCFQPFQLGRIKPTESFYYTIWGFPKWWYPTTMGFPTKNDHFGVLSGYHHLRKHPYFRDITMSHQGRFTVPLGFCFRHLFIRQDPENSHLVRPLKLMPLKTMSILAIRRLSGCPKMVHLTNFYGYYTKLHPD